MLSRPSRVGKAEEGLCGLGLFLLEQPVNQYQQLRQTQYDARTEIDGVEQLIHDASALAGFQRGGSGNGAWGKIDDALFNSVS